MRQVAAVLSSPTPVQSGVARALSMIGIVEESRGARDAAIIAFEEALEIQSALKYESGIAYSLLHLGYGTIDQRDYQRAATPCWSRPWSPSAARAMSRESCSR